MQGKTVVITGGNAGIGKEAAVELARMGASVIITSRDEARGRAAVQEVVERSGSGDVEVMARELARRLEGTGVTSNSLHPGFVRTQFGQGGDLGRLYGFGLKYLAAPFAISQAKGAETTTYLASSAEVEGATGDYFAKCRPAQPSAVAQDDDAARRLWDESERLVASVGAS